MSNEPFKPDDDYDTDAVSATSTVASGSETQYVVERAVAETVETGVSKVLIKWTDYPFYACTWEPVSSIKAEAAVVLDDWDTQKRRMGSEAFEKFNQKNIDRFYQARAIRRSKREKKRQKVGWHRQPNLNENESDDDVPLIIRHKSQNILSETRDAGQRGMLLVQSFSSSDSEGTVDSLMEEIRKGNETKHDRSPEARCSSKGQQSLIVENAFRKGSIASSTNQRPDTVEDTRKSSQQKISADDPTVLAPQGPRAKASLASSAKNVSADQGRGSANKIPQKALESSKKVVPNTHSKDPTSIQSRRTSQDVRGDKLGMAKMRRSAPSTRPGPIKIINQPRSSHKEWQSSEQFKTISYRRKAELRSRNEQTPELSALQFINGPTGGMSHPPIARDSRAVDENPYGRRESGRRRLQDNREETSPNEDAPEDPPDLGNSKIKMTCFEWRNGSCGYPAEKCFFLHKAGFPISPADGRIPGKFKNPPLTCYFWLRNPGGCTNSDEDCMYAHWNTGVLAHVGGKTQSPINHMERPRSEKVHKNDQRRPNQWKNDAEQTLPDFYRRSTKEITCLYWANGYCKHAENKCKFAHRETGHIAEAPRSLSRRSVEFTVNTMTPASQQQLLDSNGHLPVQDTLVSRHVFVESPSDISQHAMSSETAGAKDPMTAVSSPLTTYTTKSEQQLPTPQPGHQTPKLACMDLQNKIGSVCKLDFESMFTCDGDLLLNRRAFLIYHPEYHAEELELFTRWLLMHHVEVHSFWLEGAWDHFKKAILAGSTGIIMVHPDFTQFEKIPGFGQVLKQKVRLWSVGHQYDVEYDPQISTFQPPFRYDCIEIFPCGGIIYVTDDVFENQPIEALKIVELFIDKIDKCRNVTGGPIDPWKRVDDGILLWRLATRPELMDSIYKACEKYGAGLRVQDEAQSSRMKLYHILSTTEYVEQDTANEGPFIFRPYDYFPIMSERKELMDPYFEALKHSRHDANSYMVQIYAEMMIELRRDYRQFFVVHTEPFKVDWQGRWQHIDEIMTPKQCIQYFEQPAESSRFNFYDWALLKEDQFDSPCQDEMEID